MSGARGQRPCETWEPACAKTATGTLGTMDHGAPCLFRFQLTVGCLHVCDWLILRDCLHPHIHAYAYSHGTNRPNSDKTTHSASTTVWGPIGFTRSLL
eukprot:5837276-Pyramimonas_sp.AAC.1